MPNVLYLYAFYQKDVSYLQNLLYFIEHGVKRPDDRDLSINYIIIINGTMALDLTKITGNPPNVRIIFRENKDFDFGAYIHAIDTVNENASSYWQLKPSDYDYVFFMNASVRGPFLPVYYQGHYLRPFLDLFQSASDVHLVGTTINVLDAKSTNGSREAHMFRHITNGAKPPYTHVQSMFFGMDRKCFRFLAEQGFWNMKAAEKSEKTDFVRFIAEREIMMSHLVLRIAKWNIGSIVREYIGRDYRNLEHDPNPTSIHGDPCFHGSCFGRTMHPYELIFIKTNRNINNDAIVSLSKIVK